MTVKIAPKTSWCQECIKEGEELHQIQRGDIISWVCDECFEKISVANSTIHRKLTAKMKAAKEANEAKEKAKDDLVKHLQEPRAVSVRKIKPGEKLPEARFTNYSSGVPLRSRPSPMDYHAGFIWSYGWGLKEDE
jgi:hypothetical protein